MTEQAESTQIATTTQQPRNELRLSGPRLPYHPLIEERFGIDRGTWKFLTDVLYPSAEEPETIINVLAYCKARKLDVLKKPVHVVPVYDKKRSRMVDSVWPSIAEVRITAMRTGHYAGKDETAFGPDKTENLGGVDVTYPEWAQVTVYRFVAGVACAFVGEKVRWKEYYAKAKRDTLAPNDMWKTKTYSQLAKCAEANALRCAFPEEDGGPTAEEMSGQEVEGLTTVQHELGTSVLTRLQQQPVKPTEGFNAAALEALGSDEQQVEAETPHDPETGEIPDAVIEEPEPAKVFPPKARDEINGPAPAGVIYMLAGDPVSDAGRVPTYKDGEKHSNAGEKGAAQLARYTMHPTKPGDVVDHADDAAAEIADEFPGDKPAPSTATVAEAMAGLADDEDGEWHPLEQCPGPAPRGVEYTLAGEEIGSDDCAQSYIDGEPFQRVNFDEFAKLPEYEAHPEPLAEEVEEDLPEWQAAILADLRTATEFGTIQQKLPGIYNGDDFKKLDYDDKAAFRRAVYAVAVGLKSPPSHTDSPSFFRLWADTQAAGAEGSKAVNSAFLKLKGSLTFGRMPAASQESLTQTVALIVKRLAEG